MDQTVAAPAGSEQPGSRGDDGRRFPVARCYRDRIGEAIEPFGGRERIDARKGAACGVGDVLLAVLEHIDERVAHLPRGGERAAVPAIRPEAAATKKQPIHALGKANHEAAHACRKGRFAVSFDDQVQMVLLH